jgi:protein SCO1
VADGDRLQLPRWAKVAAGIFVVIAVAVMAFATLKPIKVLPRIRVAPGFALVDQSGASFTSEATRGLITIYTFVPNDCGDECADVNATMGDLRVRMAALDLSDLDDLRIELVTIVESGDVSAAELAATADAAGADGDAWRFVTGTEVQLETVVGLGFRHARGLDSFSPHFVIVDGWGMVRGDYRYSTQVDDADKLSSHIDLLLGEIRHSSGIASLAYGAAHVFSCYP